jgi:hypothetical protein
VFLTNDRYNQENLLAQLNSGVHALTTPVNDLVSNWAYIGTDHRIGSIPDQMNGNARSSGSKRIFEVVYFAVLFPGTTDELRVSASCAC